jgi:uncharacterized membrane protein
MLGQEHAVKLMKEILGELSRKLGNIGKSPICNDRPDRAPHIGSVCFPLCWRCTSYMISIIGIGFFRHILVSFYFVFGVYLFSAIMVFTGLPIVIDGVRQYYFFKESTNQKRIITGILAGLSANMLILVIRFGLNHTK